MNGRDMIAVLEYVKAFKDKPTKPLRVKKEKEKDFFSELIETQHKMEQFQKWLKDQEKLNKKEDKKDEKNAGMSVIHMVMTLVILSVMSGPFYFWMFGKLAGKW